MKKQIVNKYFETTKQVEAALIHFGKSYKGKSEVKRTRLAEVSYSQLKTYLNDVK